MKQLINRIICFLFDHDWSDRSNLIDDHTIHMNWKCKRCGKREWKIVDVNKYEENI